LISLPQNYNELYVRISLNKPDYTIWVSFTICKAEIDRTGNTTNYIRSGYYSEAANYWFINVGFSTNGVSLANASTNAGTATNDAKIEVFYR
jgi:hypothetical protein